MECTNLNPIAENQLRLMLPF